MAEQREHPRVDVELVLFDTSTGTYASVTTRNVSAGGAYLVIPDRPPVGTALRLAVTRRGTGARARVRELLEVRGEVRRHGDDGIGVEFVDPSDEVLAALTLAGDDSE